MNRAIFLDRDGIINVDTNYVKSINDVKIYPDVTELKKLKLAGFKLVVVSNQAGVEKGYISKAQFQRVHDEINNQLILRGVPIDRYYYCFKSESNFRKPNIGMLLKAKNQLDINLERSYMIGDKITDVKAGLRSHCITFGLDRDETRDGVMTQDIIVDKEPRFFFYCKNLKQFVDFILQHNGR